MPDTQPVFHGCLQTERFRSMEKSISNLEHDMYGNGNPGLKIRVNNNEMFLQNEVERRKTSASRVWAIYLLVFSNVMFLLRDVIKELIP